MSDEDGGLRLKGGVMRLEDEQVGDTPMHTHCRQPAGEKELIENEFNLQMLHHWPCTLACEWN